MTGHVILVFILSITVISVDLSAKGNRDTPDQVEYSLGSIVEKTGIIHIKGNEPFSKPVLVTPSGEEYILAGSLLDDLKKLQFQSVTILGEITVAKIEKRYAEVDVSSYETTD